jgi:hypothetical protein
MKEMCLPCYGTGQIRCLVCGGTGLTANISLLGEDCLKCKGSRKGRCQLCRGSGFIGGDVVPSQYRTEAMIDQTLADSFPASDPPSWTLGLDNQSGFSAELASLIEVPKNKFATHRWVVVERTSQGGM